MANDFYNRAFNPLPGQRVDEQVLKDEFQRIEQGFDEVQSDADRAIKLPVGTADQTLALNAVQRANLVLSFDASGNITAISYGRWRADWVTATAYVVSDHFRYAGNGNIYAVVANHTSGVFATDLADGKIQLMIDVATVTAASATAVAAAAAAAGSASAADASADAAAASAQEAADVVATIPDGTINDATITALNVWSALKVDAVTSLVRSARTSNTILGFADKRKWIDITSGTFTQTFAAAATLGDGWFCWLGNSGTGDITLDPNSTETIDGLTSYIMYPGEVRLVQCDGTALRSIVVNGYLKTFITSGVWTKPPGYRSHDGVLDGGGGSGGRYVSGQNSLGGTGGARAFFSFVSSLLSATEGVTVGTGGVAQTVDASPGNAGGLSQFKTAIAYGGLGGNNSSTRFGGFAFISDITNSTAAGALPATSDAFYGGAGAQNSATGSGRSVYGNGAGASISDTNALFAAPITIFGSPGGNTNAAGTAATAGTAPGGGGGGARNGNASGAGARGEVKIWGVI